MTRGLSLVDVAMALEQALDEWAAPGTKCPSMDSVDRVQDALKWVKELDAQHAGADQTYQDASLALLHYLREPKTPTESDGQRVALSQAAVAWATLAQVELQRQLLASGGRAEERAEKHMRMQTTALRFDEIEAALDKVRSLLTEIQRDYGSRLPEGINQRILEARKELTE